MGSAHLRELSVTSAAAFNTRVALGRCEPAVFPSVKWGWQGSGRSTRSSQDGECSVKRFPKREHIT